MNNHLSDLRGKLTDAQNNRLDAENEWNHVQNTGISFNFNHDSYTIYFS